MQNILVFYGGDSCESDISIITAMQAIPHLDKNRYNVFCVLIKDKQMYLIQTPCKISTYVNWREKKHKKVCIANRNLMLVKNKKHKKITSIDCALLCNHGGMGEDGSLQGFLDINNIPYTSCGVNASAIGMDKIASKLVFKSLGLKVLPYVVIAKSGYSIAKTIEKVAKLGYPVIVKPSNQGSSIGIDIAHNEMQLEERLAVAFEYSDNALVEKALEGCSELNCACYAINDKLVVSTIEKPSKWQGLLSFDDKYLSTNSQGEFVAKENNWENNQSLQISQREFPAQISADKTKKIQDCVAMIYRNLNMKGVVRFDFLLDEKQDAYINEYNSIPGSLAFYLFEDKNISMSTLLENMIDHAIVCDIHGKKNKFESKVLINYNNKWAKGCKIK